jgi:hypothetical protein
MLIYSISQLLHDNVNVAQKLKCSFVLLTCNCASLYYNYYYVEH